jgi:Zn-dependent protease
VHAPRLKELAAEAQLAEGKGDTGAALAAWRSALEILPVGTRQYQQVSARVNDLSTRLSADSSAPVASRPGMRAGPLAGLGAAGLVLLSKAKLLFLGLAKLPTLLSMIAFFGVYWSVWGWRFALGLVAAIYVHEMGHVWELRRYGLPATAPMFIPGFGAVVRLKARPANVYEDARVGLAGPWWGLGAAIAAGLGGWATDLPSVSAVAYSAAWMNTFNLLPVGSLDGSRGFASLSKAQRAVVAAGCFAAGYVTGETVFYLVGVVAVVRVFSGAANPRGDGNGVASFVMLVVLLATVMVLSNPHLQR